MASVRSTAVDPLNGSGKLDVKALKALFAVLRETAAGKGGQFDEPLDFRRALGVVAAEYWLAPLRARVIVVRPERQKRGTLFRGDLGWAKVGSKRSGPACAFIPDRRFER